MKKAWMAVAALAAGLAAAAWGADKNAADEGYRAAVERAAGAARTALETAPFDGSATVAILPVHGDEGGWVSELLKIALSDAGKACVQLEGDPMWEEIGRQLVWNERSEDILDPATVDLISRKTLMSAKVLMTGRVRKTTSRSGRPGAELSLHATEVATARHIWGGVFRSGPGGAFGTSEKAEEGSSLAVSEALVPLNVGLAVKAGQDADMEADLVETYARGRLADLGYRVASGKADDLTLALETTCEPFDQTGNYWVFEGTLKASVAVHGGDARELGATTIASRGARGLGAAQAHRNLADEMEAQLGAWLKRTLDPEAVSFAAARLTLALAEPIELAEDYKAIDEIQKALAGLDGVRSARVDAQDNRKGTVEFVVVHERAKLPTGVWNALWAAHPEWLDLLK